MSKLSVRDFFQRFPDDDACLAHILAVRFGDRHEHVEKVDAETGEVTRLSAGTFHKITGRRAYACSQCGDHIYPCAGTVFQDSRTPLTMWFYAIYLFVTTRHGVSGRELSRQLGVTVKTGWRIGQQVRKLMEKADGFEALRLHVEADETYVGGRIKGGKRGRATDSNKTVVAGLAQRGGRKVAKVVPDASTRSLKPFILENVEPGTMISTDEHGGYRLLTKYDYQHGRVNHSKEEWSVTVDGVRHSTNELEGFWSLFKRSVAGTHIHVSKKYMDRYLNEFTFRSNHRQMGNAMFDLLIGAV